MYVEREVDLTAGDVVLPDEELEIQEFIDATLLRREQHQAEEESR